MTQLFIKFITGYQIFISPVIKQILGVRAMCRYPLSCSEFAKLSIKRHGALRGGMLAIKRILACGPFSKPFLTFNN